MGSASSPSGVNAPSKKEHYKKHLIDSRYQTSDQEFLANSLRKLVKQEVKGRKGIMEITPPTISNSLCRTIVNTTQAPSAIGPYNQGVMVDKTLYISGQLGLNTTGEMVGGGVVAEAEQALTNIGNILAAAGGGFKDVIKTTVLMKDINKFSEVNGIYGKFFTSHQPARAAFQVAALPKAGNVEIEAVAVIGAVNVGSILINGML